MTREEYLSEIMIAKKYLNQYHLLANKETVVLECCYYPPFHHKTFFMQIFKTKNFYQVNCAYTFYADHLGLKSYSKSFNEIEENNLHSSIKSDIICKTFIPTQAIITELISSIQNYKENSSDNNIKIYGICIDGETSYIQQYFDNQIIKELILENSPQNIFDILKQLSEEI